MATMGSHKFNVPISVDVNNDSEYRYTPLCLCISGVSKHAQKIVFLVAEMGYKSLINFTDY